MSEAQILYFLICVYAHMCVLKALVRVVHVWYMSVCVGPRTHARARGDQRSIRGALHFIYGVVFNIFLDLFIS